MSVLLLTNQKYSQAFRGETATVTLNSSDALAHLSFIQVGMHAQVDSSSKDAIVESVDYYGNSFRITPYMPTDTVESTPGYLGSGETIAIIY